MGVKTWSLTLRVEHRMRIFENRVLRRISGPKRDEITPDIIRQIKSRRLRWAGHMACMGDERKIQDFGGKVQRKETTQKTEAWMGECVFLCT
jgi:hypothetical protein